MLNRVQLIGNLGKDPEIKVLPSNIEVAIFSMATSKKWKDKHTNETKELTAWHNVVIYNQSVVKFVKEYVKKGDMIFIEGELQNRKWTDDAGKAHYVTEVVLNGPDGRLQKLGGRDKLNSDSASNNDIPQYDSSDDDIPF
jgi:single-strand DNA-binding protein